MATQAPIFPEILAIAVLLAEAQADEDDAAQLATRAGRFVPPAPDARNDNDTRRHLRPLQQR